MHARAKIGAKRIATAVVIAIGMGMQPPPAGAVVLAAGACYLRIELTGAVEPLPLPSTAGWTLIGAGVCVVDDEDLTAPATVAGTLGGLATGETVGAGCLAAVLDGVVTLDVTTGGYGSMTGDMTVALSAAGAAPLVTFTGTTFAAVGMFVQSPFDTLACACGDGAASLTWKGALVFEDPVL